MKVLIFLEAYSHSKTLCGKVLKLVSVLCNWIVNSSFQEYIFKHWIGKKSISGRIQFAFLYVAIHMAREHHQNAIQYLYLHLFTTKFGAILLTLQGFFSVHFMAEIRLYSKCQIISFFRNFCPKIPNSKDQKMCGQTKDFRGIKAEENE